MTAPSDPHRDPRKIPPAGDADAVPDTPSVAKHGAEPDERRKSPRGAAPSGGGVPWLVWIIVGIIAVAAVMYLLGK